MLQTVPRTVLCVGAAAVLYTALRCSAATFLCSSSPRFSLCVQVMFMAQQNIPRCGYHEPQARPEQNRSLSSGDWCYVSTQHGQHFCSSSQRCDFLQYEIEKNNNNSRHLYHEYFCFTLHYWGANKNKDSIK